jgi:hypothetical protein
MAAEKKRRGTAMPDHVLVPTAEAKRPAGTADALREAGDYYSLQRKLEEEQAAAEPQEESSLVPDAGGGFDITSGPPPVDVADAPQPKKPRYLPDMTYYSVPPLNLPDLVNTPLEQGMLEPGAMMNYQRLFLLKMREMLALFEWDECLAMAQLKVASNFARAMEKSCDNCAQQGQKLAAEILVLEREDDGTEIHGQMLEQKRERRRMLRIQWQGLSLLFRVARDEFDRQVALSGIDMPRYETLKEMAAKNARRRDEWRLAQQLKGKSEAEYRVWLEQQGSYRVQHNGVEASLEAAMTNWDDVRARKRIEEEKRLAAKRRRRK